MAKTARKTFAQLLASADDTQRLLAAKVPSWAAVEGLAMPPRLSLEQCSGEAAARYKAEVVGRLCPERRAMADITGGYGVDFSFLAPLFTKAFYAEQRPELCDAARRNFPLLGLENAEILEGDGPQLLEKLPHLNLLFLDPARRDAKGRKTVLIEDCSPNVLAFLPRLQAAADRIVVKLSPMLDATRAAAALGCVEEVHVVGDGSECKELLLVLGPEKTAAPRYYVADGPHRFAFTQEEEAAAPLAIADAVEEFLYEPSPAVMKAGCFRTLSARFAAPQLHPNSHLYTATQRLSDFPGRAFRVEAVTGFSKDDARRLRALTDRANIAVRNFPTPVAELRRRLRLADGGDRYLFATTLKGGEHRLLVCRKAEQGE